MLYLHIIGNQHRQDATVMECVNKLAEINSYIYIEINYWWLFL